MSEIKINAPCTNCEVAGTLQDSENIELIALEGLFMAVTGQDSLIACRHPWRVLKNIYGDNPSEIQLEVMSKVVEIRGKDPEEYGLPKVNKISTLDI